MGTHLANAVRSILLGARNREVDSLGLVGRRLITIEVKSDRTSGHLPEIAAFVETFHPDRKLLTPPASHTKLKPRWDVHIARPRCRRQPSGA